MYISYIAEEASIMRTTVNLDEELVEEARRITGTRERTALIHFYGPCRRRADLDARQEAGQGGSGIGTGLQLEG